MQSFAFDYPAMRQRKAAYYAFVRDTAAQVFKPDGSYQPSTEDDARISYWMYPALIDGDSAHQRTFANVVYAAAPRWDEWDVFNTSVIAANLVRDGKHMTPELVQRSEDHLARFVDRDGGRSPCSGANDYAFQGYNDNMPAMSMRALILAGDALGRADYTDHGLFKLEGACAHFERRGLLSEYTSNTYTGITLVAFLDIAECTTNSAAREMAAACANRILLDIFGHWHQHIGGLGGAQSRAYTADKQEWLTVLNAMMWYLTGSDCCLNPIEILGNLAAFPGYVHHGASLGFNLAQFVEAMGPSFEGIDTGVREFCARPRAYPYELLATTDAGQSGDLGGVKAIQTRAWHQRRYGLGSADQTWFNQSGQQLTLHAVLSRGAASGPAGWRNRISLWHQLAAGTEDQGDTERYHDQPAAEVGHVCDVGHYRVLQQRGSALVLGAIAPVLLDREVSQLRFSVLFNTRLHQPDEAVAEGPWQFLRFGEVFVGVRMAGMVAEQPVTPRLVNRNDYLRLELPLISARTVKIDQAFREWCDFGYVLEIAEEQECGSFADFRTACLGATWEYYHCAYRTSRYCGRHGELQIIDSLAAGTTRFMAVDGTIEPQVKLAATGLEPRLTQLFTDGRIVKQRRLMYRPDFIGSPFYDLRSHIVANDARA